MSLKGQTQALGIFEVNCLWKLFLGDFFFLCDEAVAISDVAWLYSEEEQGKHSKYSHSGRIYRTFLDVKQHFKSKRDTQLL